MCTDCSRTSAYMYINLEVFLNYLYFLLLWGLEWPVVVGNAVPQPNLACCVNTESSTRYWGSFTVSFHFGYRRDLCVIMLFFFTAGSNLESHWMNHLVSFSGLQRFLHNVLWSFFFLFFFFKTLLYTPFYPTCIRPFIFHFHLIVAYTGDTCQFQYKQRGGPAGWPRPRGTYTHL